MRYILAAVALSAVFCAGCGQGEVAGRQGTSNQFATYHYDGNGDAIGFVGELVQEDSCLYLITRDTKHLAYFPKGKTTFDGTAVTLEKYSITLNTPEQSLGGWPRVPTEQVHVPTSCDKTLPGFMIF